VFGARRLKVEMVLPELRVGGMEVMAARLTRSLSRRGHDVGITCIVEGGPLADQLRGDGYRVTVVRAPGLLTNIRAPRLEQWLRDVEPDIVHTHSGAWLKAVRAARRGAVRCVIHTEHGLYDPEPWYGGALRRRAARYTDCVVAVSNPLRAMLTRKDGLEPDQVRVIPNGVDINRFAPAARTGDLHRRLGIDDSRMLIAAVGRLAPVKNHAMLLHAFALLRTRHANAALVIIGEGTCRAALQERISSHGLTGHAFLLGEAPDVAKLYRDLDLFVLSSKHEGMPMSVLEAMASGVPVVATSVGGIPDLLAHGRLGWLAPSDDAVALGEVMHAAIEDVDRRRSVALDARSEIVERYSEDTMLEAYERLYYQRSAAEPALGGSKTLTI
jgi:glycosyltransferase involved in cell wall biosynthesis